MIKIYKLFNTLITFIIEESKKIFLIMLSTTIFMLFNSSTIVHAEGLNEAGRDSSSGGGLWGLLLLLTLIIICESTKFKKSSDSLGLEQNYEVSLEVLK